MTNEYTEQDRACVNCRHFRRRWNPIALFDTVISDGSLHYRCTHEGIDERINPVTGRKKIIIRDSSCQGMRQHGNLCGVQGNHWQPSENFKRQKGNLFKILKNK